MAPPYLCVSSHGCTPLAIGVSEDRAFEQALRRPTYAYDPDALMVDDRASRFTCSATQSGKTCKNIVIPEHGTVHLSLTASDVPHTLVIPELRLVLDAMPGQITELRVAGRAPGRLEAQCSGDYGAGHPNDEVTVVVLDNAAFEVWAASEGCATSQ